MSQISIIKKSDIQEARRFDGVVDFHLKLLYNLESNETKINLIKIYYAKTKSS